MYGFLAALGHVGAQSIAAELAGVRTGPTGLPRDIEAELEALKRELNG
jgi:hypothetical protein